MMRATPYVMDMLGYYAGGPCYDEGMPAYVAPCGKTWLVVGHFDDYWFCEDTDGDHTVIADTAGQALDAWLDIYEGVA